MNDEFLYIIAGCNGAGKTTASYNILPELLKCKNFVNADEIAKGLSPFSPDSVSLQAGKLMLDKIQELLKNHVTFAFETTLSAKSYQKTIVKAQQKGYKVILIFFWLESIALAKERVKIRVQEGGHFIPDEVIERRYKNGLKNLFEIYFPICDEVILYDHSKNNCEKIFFQEKDKDLVIFNSTTYKKIKEITYEK